MKKRLKEKAFMRQCLDMKDPSVPNQTGGAKMSKNRQHQHNIDHDNNQQHETGLSENLTLLGSDESRASSSPPTNLASVLKSGYSNTPSSPLPTVSGLFAGLSA